MKENKEDNNINKSLDFLEISSRLVIKNIPESLSDTKIIEILKKNFEEQIKNDILIYKQEKKYSMKKRNKICYITVNNLEIRNKVYEFFSTFELVDPRGIKQKLTVNDAIYQSRQKGIDDPINNTIDTCEHFLKFKEYFSKEKLVDFKNEENNFCDNLYDGVDFKISLNENKNQNNNNKNTSPSKMKIIKKENNNIISQVEEKNEIEEINNDNDITVENNNNRNRYPNNKVRNNNNYYDKTKYKDNQYNNNKKDNYYNDYNYDSYKNKKDYYNDYNNYDGHNNYDKNYYGKYNNNYNKKNGYRNKGYK